MTRLDPPDSFLIPTCLKFVTEEFSRLALLGELDLAQPIEEPMAYAGLPRHLVLQEQPRYSIQVPESPAEVYCPHTGKPFWAAGPTAYEDDQPISDLAMLDGCRELGMLLAVAAVTRAFGAVSLAAPAVSREALYQLAAFARVYETFAARSGPRRPFDLPSDEDAEDDRSE